MIVLHRHQILQKNSHGEWYIHCEICKEDHGHHHQELMARSSANNHRWDCPGRTERTRAG